jgi:beta-fructofuranosidase
MLEPTEDTLAIRQRLAADWQRPIYHYLPPANWMNDPNGLLQWEGQFHLFYQYNPHAAFHADMHWGHAVSADLIHWADWPIALAPDDPYDEAGVFSGCAVNHAGVPTIIYTGTRGERSSIQTQCIATSADGLLTWQKYAGNPVINQIPEISGQSRDFRDPFVWREADAWYMVVGSRIAGNGGTVFLYRSADLIHWDYLNPILIGDHTKNGVMWECPNLFRLGDKWVLIVSAHLGQSTGTVFYFVGDFENEQFTPQVEGVLDHGYLYAPLTLQDDQGRRLLWGWLREGRTVEAQKNSGWSGVQSVPRVLSLDADLRLVTTPVPEHEQLRGTPHTLTDQDIETPVTLEVGGLALEIKAEFDPQGRPGIALACAPDGPPGIAIVYLQDTQQLVVTRASHNPQVDVYEQVADHPLRAGETLQLHILLDGSVVEIIANGRTSLTSRIYPEHAEHHGVQVLGEQAYVHLLTIWPMESIWLI